MEDIVKYLRRVSDEIKILQGDIQKMVVAKKQQLKEESKKEPEESKEKEKPNIVSPKEKFKQLSLNSLQPVTKLYKSEKELKQAQQNPEEDFITKKLEDIFSK